MADKTDLLEVYDFIYNISSDVVHFNPRVLLRMGWGDTPQDVHFTTKNFARYYVRMCRTYGVLLLLYQYQHFELQFPENAREVFSKLRYDIDSDLRWVESVTFEELNLKAPDDLQRHLLRAAHEQGEQGGT
jgi:hypothetical protein